VHQHLHPVRSPVAEQVRVMRPGGAEHRHHAVQHRLHPGAQIERLYRQPHRLDPDQRRSSRSQAAQSVAADTGQPIVRAVGPRRSSMRLRRRSRGLSRVHHPPRHPQQAIDRSRAH